MTAYRDLGPDANAALQGNHVTTVNLVELELDDQTIRIATGWWTLQWNGHDWHAGGKVLQISEVEETVEVRAPSVQITVSSVDDSMREAAQDALYTYPNRPMTIYLAILGPQNTILGVDIVWKGRISTMRIIDHVSGRGGGRADVQIIGRHKFGKRIRQSTERRLSDAQQRARYPNAGGPGVPDEGLKFLATISERVFTFGRR